MQKDKSRSTCPIGKTLDIVGDRWSLLILREIIFVGRSTYKELSMMPEHIATNLLAERLNRLEAVGIIRKVADPTDGRKHTYLITQKGLDLRPVLFALIDWGLEHTDNAEVPRTMNLQRTL